MLFLLNFFPEIQCQFSSNTESLFLLRVLSSSLRAFLSSGIMTLPANWWIQLIYSLCALSFPLKLLQFLTYSQLKRDVYYRFSNAHQRNVAFSPQKENKLVKICPNKQLLPLYSIASKLQTETGVISLQKIIEGEKLFCFFRLSDMEKFQQKLVFISEWSVTTDRLK